MSEPLKYPDFLVIGAQKAGTTWLHRNLQAHPGVWMPKEKELHYFDEKIKREGGLLRRLRGDRPMDKRWRRQATRQLKYYRKNLPSKRISIEDVRWDYRYFFERPDNEWYASLFARGKGRLTGEVTPDYSVLSQEAVARVHEIMPAAKIIFFMRNPVERHWSAVDMGLRFNGTSPERATDSEIQAVADRPKLRIFSQYRRTLDNWGAFYPPEQMYVGFLEDAHFHPEELLREVYDFLGVNPSFKPRSPSRKIHSRSTGRMPTEVATRMARLYDEEIGWLAERFGGYASFWQYCARKLLEDPPAEERMIYPLYESQYWEEWNGADRVGLQSSPLSSFGDV